MQNNDPSKPTCRVVKRQGQRGARIHPLGCQVRAEVDLVPAELQAEAGPPLYFDHTNRYDGEFYRGYTKQGKNKVFIKQSGRNMDSMFFVSVHAADGSDPAPNSPNWVEFMWDTGATYVSMSSATADLIIGPRWRRLDSLGVYNVDWRWSRATLADGSTRSVIIIMKVPMLVKKSGTLLEEKIHATASVYVDGVWRFDDFKPTLDSSGRLTSSTDASNLFGVSGQQQIRTLRLKFR